MSLCLDAALSCELQVLLLILLLLFFLFLGCWCVWRRKAVTPSQSCGELGHQSFTVLPKTLLQERTKKWKLVKTSQNEWKRVKTSVKPWEKQGFNDDFWLFFQHVVSRVRPSQRRFPTLKSLWTPLARAFKASLFNQLKSFREIFLFFSKRNVTLMSFML